MILRTPRDFGALIRQRRKDAGLDQATLAQKIGVSRWWIHEIERGKPRAELGLVLQALTALGVKLSTTESAEAAQPAAHKPSLTDVLARARGESR